MKLKILSLWQPHATLCVTPSKYNPKRPAKPVETRHWPTNHRGWLGMHSAMKKAPFYKHLCSKPEFAQYIEDFEKLPFGYIVGMVDISHCLATTSNDLNLFILDQSDNSATRAQEILSFGDFSDERFGFTITDFVQFTTPIKAKGGQGFWYYDMPNYIGENVQDFTGTPGIILDHNPEQHPYPYLVKFDDHIKKPRWLSRDEFELISGPVIS